MKLILMDRKVVGEEDDGQDITFCGVHLYRDKVTWLNGRDDVAKQLISELFEGKSSVLEVLLEDNGSAIELKHVAKDNILKSLRDRFYDKVKISVVFGKDDDEYQFKTEEMLITSGNGKYKCFGFVEESADPVMFFGSRGRQVTMKIIATISLPDDDILSSTQLPFAKKVFQEGKFTDVTIITKEGKKVEAHKCFLSAASSVLGATLEELKSREVELDMSDLSEKGVKAFLRFVYYQDLEEPKKDLKIAYELLYAGHKYGMFPLEQWAIGHLMEKRKAGDFSVELAFTIYSFLRMRNMDLAGELKKKAAWILMSNAKDLKKFLGEDPDSAKKLRDEIAKAAKEYNARAMRMCGRKRKFSDSEEGEEGDEEEEEEEEEGGEEEEEEEDEDEDYE